MAGGTAATEAAVGTDRTLLTLSSLPPLPGASSWSQGTGTPPPRRSSPFRRPYRPPRPPPTPRHRRVDSGDCGGHDSGSGGSNGGVGLSASTLSGGARHGVSRVRAAATTVVAGAAAGVARRIPSCLRDAAQGWRSGDKGDGDCDGGGGSGSGGRGNGGSGGGRDGGGWGDHGSDGRDGDDDADGGSDCDVRVGAWEDPPDCEVKATPPSSLLRASAGSRGQCAIHGTSATGGTAGGDVDGNGDLSGSGVGGGGGRRVDPSQASSRRPSTLRFWEVKSDGRRRRRTATRVEILDAVHAAVRTARSGRSGGGADGNGTSSDSGCDTDGGWFPPAGFAGEGGVAGGWTTWAGVARRRARRPGGRRRVVPPPAGGWHPPHNLLQLRDLRQVDPAFVAKPALWVRRNALILSLGGIRALILHDRLFLFDPDAPAVAGAYRVVAGRLTGLVAGNAAGGGAEGAGTPFEFQALEGLLIAVVVSLERSFWGVEPGLVDTLAALANDLSVGRLEELRASEQRLVAFQGDARAARQVLVDALADDPGLAAMYLSDGVKHPGRRRNPLDHAEVEQLLEAYLQLVDDLATRSTLLLRAIDDTETLVVIHLDILQNHLLLVALLISMASTVLAAGSTVTALFGMNLALPPAMATLPSSATYFWGVLAGLVGGMTAAFAALLGFGHAAGLLPRAPKVRAPWLLQEVSAARRRRKEKGGGKATGDGEEGQDAGGGGEPESPRAARTASRDPLAQLAVKARAWPRARKAELARRAAAAAGDALDDAGEALNEAGDALGAASDALGAAEDALGVVGESPEAAVKRGGEEEGFRR